MVNAEYKHPHYSTDSAVKSVIKNESQHKIIRFEYPDEVIVIFDIKLSGVTLHSNYNYHFNVDTNVITPRLDSPNKNFTDVI
ncbi:hypothetical protein [Alkalibacterium thalassium]|uniref:Uncharacterized protein n=1 Tax=Alkalibacterium thalassium TaxID=426701 RepID=A0A1G8VU68_9LACT|nr:hypothetical protein [Alkalibacterium thalassium]SDJ68995.1 hypothetical protein SAMN04488098_100284 [Alkalibacterium thalassium]